MKELWGYPQKKHRNKIGWYLSNNKPLPYYLLTMNYKGIACVVADIVSWLMKLVGEGRGTFRGGGNSQSLSSLTLTLT